MALLSQYQFAKQIGVSKQYVSKAVQSGIIPAEKGKINPDDPAVKEYLERKKEVDSGRAQASVRVGADILTKPKVELEKIKLIKQINQLDLDTKIKRGDFISKDLVRMVFSKLYAIENNELLHSGDRIAPIIVARVGGRKAKTAEVTAIIEKEMYRVMGSIKKTFSEYLEEIDIVQ